MRLESADVEILRPFIKSILIDMLAEIRADEDKLSGQLAYGESEAAALLGVARHVLRDARLRGELEASRIGKKVIYSRDDLLNLLARNRITE